MAAVKNFHGMWVRRSKLVWLGTPAGYQEEFPDCKMSRAPVYRIKGRLLGCACPWSIFSLKQETVWVVSSALGMDWMASLEPISLMLLRGVSYTLLLSQCPCQLLTPSSGAVEFSPHKEQLSLSLSDQSLGVHCGSLALQHLDAFLLSQGPSGNNVASVC